MFSPDKAHIIGLAAASIIAIAAGQAAAAVRFNGQVQAGGGSVAGATVTLWAGSGGDPKQMARARTADDGSFALSTDETPGPGVSLYVIAKGGVASVNKGAGDNPALAFLAVLGGSAPANVTVNEMTTVASVWTNAQFLDGAAIKGPALSLGIAAGNVPNFVDLSTGGWGGPSRTRSTAARRRRWRTSPRSPMRSRVARRGSRPSPAKCFSRRQSRRRATRRAIR
jgi:hypothetical protein